MKKVLVTGATGFIGQHCITPLIAKGFEVHAVSSKVHKDDSVDVHWHQADLLDTEEVFELLSAVQPSHLLHFAWYTVTGKYWNSMENFRWVQASLDLLLAFSANSGARAIIAGSCSEYDWNYAYCSEKITPLVPDTVYGNCKHALQTMLDAFSKQTGLSIAWGRIFFLYGPHEWPTRLVSSVIQFLLQNKPALCSHGNQLRDYLYVQDVAEAFVELLESDLQGAVNIASGNPVALRDIIFNIAGKLNGMDLVHLGALETAPHEPPMIVADVRRLTEELKWRPKIDLDTGLDLTINWVKENFSRTTY